MTRLILILTVAIAAVTFSPSPAAASCTRDYIKCLNDSYDLEGIYQELANIECAAAYTGCVIGQLRFW